MVVRTFPHIVYAMSEHVANRHACFCLLASHIVRVAAAAAVAIGTVEPQCMNGRTIYMQLRVSS